MHRFLVSCFLISAIVSTSGEVSGRPHIVEVLQLSSLEESKGLFKAEIRSCSSIYASCFQWGLPAVFLSDESTWHTS